MAGLLFGVRATDLVTFSIVPLILVETALLATYVPVRRATRVDPMVALRED
jgi:putative ABC transport system permease protein